METVANFVVTSELVQPVVNTINSGLTTLVPIGLGIMATFIGWVSANANVKSDNIGETLEQTTPRQLHKLRIGYEAL